MIDLNVTGDNWNRNQRNGINENWQRIKNGLSNLQGQIKILAGGEEVDELLKRLNDAVESATVAVQESIDANNTATQDAITANNQALQIALNTIGAALTDVGNAIQAAETATNDAMEAKDAALQAAGDAQTTISQMQVIISNFRPRGEWNATTDYFKNNLAGLNGKTYIALQNNTNKPVTDTSFWMLFADRGAKGERGEKGEPGTGIKVLGHFNDVSELPSNPTLGDAYTIGADRDLYVYNGNDWQNLGSIKGVEGKSAYEVAVENGFVGTEIEWLETLIGPPGPDGPPGPPADLTEINQKVDGLQNEVTEHSGQIATTEKLGHIKPDGETITVDPVTGVAIATVANIDTKVYSGDLNNLTENGYYSVPANTPNAPGSTPWLVEVAVSADATYVVQTARHGGSNNLRENVFQRVAVKDGSGQFIWGTVTSGTSGYLGNWKIVSMNISDAIDSETPLTGASSKAVKQLNDSKANKIQETSFSPSLQNGWLASSTPKLYKDEFGVVHLTAEIHSGTTASGTTMLTLPVNYRPNNLSNIVFMGITYANNSGTSPVSAINFFVSNGELKTLYTAQKYVLIDISFRV